MAIHALILARGTRRQLEIAQAMNARGFLNVQCADISRWEGGSIPRGPKLRAYAEILGMTTDEIIDIYQAEAARKQAERAALV